MKKTDKQDAGREFADIWAEAVQSNRNLRILTVSLGISLFLVLIITLRLAWQPAPKPIVIRVDEVGRAEALAYEAATAKADPLDPTTKYFLNRFIHDFYSRRTATVQDHWTRSLRFLTTDLADKAFADSSEQIALVSGGFAQEESQVENVVLRIHVAEEPPHGATADFDLVALAREQETERQRWSLSIQFVFLQEVPPALVVYNPMGIMITYLQADRALVTGQGINEFSAPAGTRPTAEASWFHRPPS